jgi:hypothetical protein
LLRDQKIAERKNIGEEKTGYSGEKIRKTAGKTLGKLTAKE